MTSPRAKKSVQKDRNQKRIRKTAAQNERINVFFFRFRSFLLLLVGFQMETSNRALECTSFHKGLKPLVYMYTTRSVVGALIGRGLTLTLGFGIHGLGVGRIVVAVVGETAVVPCSGTH